MKPQYARAEYDLLRIPLPLWRSLSQDARYLTNAECIRGQWVSIKIHHPNGGSTFSSIPIWLLPRNRPAKRQKPVKFWKRDTPAH